MKVALFTDTYYPNVNGVVKTIGRIEAYLKKTEVDYKVFYPGEKMDTTNHQHFFGAKFLLYPEIQLAMIPYLWFRSMVRAYKPDVIHIYTEGPLGYMARKYAKEFKIPYITSYTTDFQSYLNFYNLDLFKSQLDRYLYKMHSRAYTSLVPSAYSMDMLKGIGLSNMTLWGRGIDTDKFNPAYKDSEVRAQLIGQGDFLFLYCGRLAKEKHIDVLLDAMKQIEAKGRKATLLIVGDGPERSELEKEAGKNVRFLGYQSGQALSTIYASSDAFVFASEHETFGNVILEAMASKLPVIAIDRGGVKENLRHLHNGIAIQDNTGDNFARAMELLMDHPKMCKNLSENGYTDASQKTWDTLLSCLVRLYEEAIYTYDDTSQLA